MDTDKRIKELLLEKTSDFDINYNARLIKIVDNYITFTKCQTIMMKNYNNLLDTANFLLNLKLKELNIKESYYRKNYPIITFFTKLFYKIRHAFNNL
jgi:hypothetical protein